MAFSAHKDPEQIKEHFDPPEELEKKAKEVAALVKKSKHVIFFTGAGVSTSAGISDFRGPNGVWTMRAEGKVATSKTSAIKAVPTPSHMSIVKLVNEGKAKFLVSQNTDGLHRKSGLPPQNLAELHGNQTLEFCKKCGKEFIRDYRCRSATGVHSHETSRSCNDCGGQLYDSIINFGENLPEKEINNGFMQAESADLCIVLGSSLTVTPAADIPKRVAKRGKNLVICNLQKTPLDHLSKIRVFAKTDDLMELVMKELGLEIPKWILHRHVEVISITKDNSMSLKVSGVDPDGKEASIFSEMRLILPWNFDKRMVTLKTEPFNFDSLKLKYPKNITEELVSQWSVKELKEVYKELGGENANGMEKKDLKDEIIKNSKKLENNNINIRLSFMNHYFEPDYSLKISTQSDVNKLYSIDYDVTTREWECVKETDL